MAASGRRRKKRRGAGYTAPQTRRSAREGRAGTSPRAEGGTPAARGRPRGRPRPPAPWGRFPLVELVVLLSLVLLVMGFLMQGTQGVTLIIAGITLGSLAGLELSIREHFAGYRSHTTVLAGVLGVLVLALGFFLGWSGIVNLAAGLVVFAIAFFGFREAFKRRSGGLGFR
jgi:hypothetical protein